MTRSARYSFVRKNQYRLPELHLSRLFAHSVEGIIPYNGITSVNIVVFKSFLDASNMSKIIICQEYNGVHTLSSRNNEDLKIHAKLLIIL